MAKTDTAELLIRAFEATSHGAMITDAEGTILAVNHAFTEVTGWAREEVVGRSPSVLSSGRQDADFFEAMWAALKSGGHWHGEVWNRRKDGAVFPEHLTIDAVPDETGAVAHYLGIFSGLEGRRQSEASLKDLAFKDPVTGLPNRELCEDRLERALALARRRVGHLAVLLIDLHAFRKLNDTLGFDCGDLVLKAVGERLRACLRESDTIGRWGGDAFAVILPSVDGAASVRGVGLRLLAALRRPFVLAGDEIKLNGSMGGALFPADGDCAEDVLESAGRALERAKGDGAKGPGKGGLALYGDGEAEAKARRRA